MTSSIQFALLAAITSVANLNHICEANRESQETFDLVAANISRIAPGSISLNVTDGSASARVLSHNCDQLGIIPGDRLRLRGFFERNHSDGLIYAVATNIFFISHGERPHPTDVTPAMIYSGRFTDALVRVKGTVVDAFRDEADPRFTFIALACGDETLYLPSVSLSDADLARLVDATISVVGKCNSYHNIGPRAKLGFEVFIDDPNDITIEKPAPADPFDVPELSGNVRDVCLPKPGQPFRRKIRGKVLAVERNRRVIIRTVHGELSTVLLAAENPPRCGEIIEASGLPETDFYHLNLSRAIWRSSQGVVDFKEPDAKEVKSAELLRDFAGRHRFNVLYHGRIVRITGYIRNLSRESQRILVEADGELIAADSSALGEINDLLKPGTKVMLTGVCLMVTENWRPQNPFPHITEMTLVLRSIDDIEVLAYPPWWTAGRLLAILGGIITVVFLFLAYRLVRERIVRGRAELKTEERTRLAVELHDSLAQNLTGVSLEIDTAVKIAKTNPSAMSTHLATASRTLKSCRDELRNCLWDLRSRALEEPTMNKAIRQTLDPHITDVQFAVRFIVPRALLPDDLVHAILRIIRELTLNAIRHGGASQISVAGTLENGKLLFSVRDNGSGFDPASAPGVAQGHYGLTGIQERIDEFEGEFKISSSKNRGTKATICLTLPPKP